MSKFKVGDKVRRIQSGLSLLPVGYVGMVTKVSETGNWISVDNLSNEGDNVPFIADSFELVESSATDVSPPLGLMPKNIWNDKLKEALDNLESSFLAERKEEVRQAMARYIQAGMDIPKEWLEELSELSGGEVKGDTKSNSGEWIENTQTINCHPASLTGKELIEVEYRNGEREKEIASRWTYGWNQTDYENYDIVRYRIIGENK